MAGFDVVGGRDEGWGDAFGLLDERRQTVEEFAIVELDFLGLGCGGHFGVGGHVGVGDGCEEHDGGDEQLHFERIG